MVAVLLTSFALIHLSLCVSTFRWGHRGPRLWLLRALLLAMAYDNLMLAVGPLGVGSQVYTWLNVPRYVLHAGLLPLLSAYGLSVLQRDGVELARRDGAVVGCWLFVGAALLYGFAFDVIGLQLETSHVLGHSRLVSAASLPPFATLLTNALLLPMGWLHWRRTGGPYLLAGSLFIFVVNGATASFSWGFLAGNGAEVVFIFALLLTEAVEPRLVLHSLRPAALST